MIRRCTATVCCLLVLAVGIPALAQAKGGTDDGLPPEPPPEPAATDEQLKTTDADLKPTQPVIATAKGKRVESRRTWQDIVVIPRKPFIKRGRVEITPFWGATVNDNIIQHYSLGAEINYHITDVMSVGVAGMYYFKQILDQEFFTRYHYSRVPSLNKYNYTVTLNFFYVPFYGKFALFNQHIIFWEVFATAGVGGTGTEIVPKDYRYAVFTNPFSLTFPVGLGIRAFINKWLAVYLGLRDYMMVDKYEPSRGQVPDDPNTPENEELEDAKSRAKTRFINNMQFFMGLSFYFPMDFQYTTFR